jgi:hypothetical protein
VSHFSELIDDCDRDKNGKIDFEEWELMGWFLFPCCARALSHDFLVERIKHRIPMAGKHVEKVRELFEMFDTDADNTLSLNEVARLLEDIGNKITALPAVCNVCTSAQYLSNPRSIKQTAQVASQQGKYIGKKLNKLARQAQSGNLSAAEEDLMKPFEYHHLGSLAYIGNAAVFDLGKYSFMGGLAAMYAWRSVYWNEQVSLRTRALLMIDWIIRWGPSNLCVVSTWD